ncbi:hypothetical protein [Inquilinus sp. CA228]|uniref:hypothetical protein n=1 Tax=Inquilinus sp. CA228 TaxID=3455609 RepID=UPI003F8D0598
MADSIIYAHSLPGEAMDRWERLTDHQEAVAALAAEFAAVFGWAEVARLAGRLHDIGSSGTRPFQTFFSASITDIRLSRWIQPVPGRVCPAENAPSRPWSQTVWRR